MALPTASTSGYGYYYTLGPTPNVACNCLRAWLDAFKALLQRAGLGTIAVWQCTGDLDASNGVHSLGGAVDWGGINTLKARIGREMGLWDFPRPWPGNLHTHGALYGCPHNQKCAYQITAAMVYRKDGTGFMGLGGPDPLPLPSRIRTWQEGITWSRSTAALTWINQHRATTTTAPPSEDDMPLNDVDKAWLEGRLKAHRDWEVEHLKAVLEERADAHDAYVLANLKSTLPALIAEALKDQT